MSARFLACLPFILAREGGKVDDPVDRGGRTAYGVTQLTFDAWRRGRGLASGDVWNITPDEISAIYRARFWDVCKCDTLPVGLDLAVFDAAVNHGTRNAIRFLQRTIKTTDDGVFGPMSAAALASLVEAGHTPELIELFIDIRETFYKAIVERDPTQAKFSRGWSNRLAHLQTEIDRGLA